MRLYEVLQGAKSEEDVKDAYIKALGLKGVTKGLIDIQTHEIWLEAKHTGKHSSYAIFTQLLHYVQDALNKGEPIPPLWGKSASKYTQEALDEVSAHIGTHFVSFKISTHEAEFISTVKEAIKTGDIIRTQITPDNLKQVFDKWVEMIGSEISGVAEEDYALLFFADVMSDGTVSTHENLTAELLHKNNKPVFSFSGRLYELASYEGYRQFWAIYHRPPKQEYRDYLLERRDSLIPLDERSFKGAFYTPLAVVDKAYDLLAETLGKNWQKDYIVWDMCCGVGNLEVKHSNPRNIFMSTLDGADIDVMKSTKTCVSAQRFQYDYLNDDITDDGTIDYSLSNKVPASLQKAIKDGKKILVLINPPYAESGDTLGNEAKSDVATTRIANSMSGYGYATRELFVQFVVRIASEMPNATLAMFSTLKYVNASNFDKFREQWNATYLDGFVVHSKAFDGLSGNFPIGFLIWKTDQLAKKKSPITEISTGMLDKAAQAIGQKKFFNIANEKLLSNWIIRPRANSMDVVPLKNAVTPATATKDLRGTKWADDAIGCLVIKGPDVQNASTQALLSSGYGSAGTIFVTTKNLWQAAIIFAVRRLVKPTWINNRDQFLQASEPLSEEFKTDCLIWMLFNGSNLTASADDLDWNGKKWSIVNHFIPYTETEVNATGRFESDFMVQYLADKILSPEASHVLANGKILWQSYFGYKDVRMVRDEFKLNRADVGWYQVRNALKARNASGDFAPIDFKPFELAYQALSDKLRPMVYELGFLK